MSMYGARVEIRRGTYKGRHGRVTDHFDGRVIVHLLLPGGEEAWVTLSARSVREVKR